MIIAWRVRPCLQVDSRVGTLHFFVILIVAYLQDLIVVSEREELEFFLLEQIQINSNVSQQIQNARLRILSLHFQDYRILFGWVANLERAIQNYLIILGYFPFHYLMIHDFLILGKKRKVEHEIAFIGIPIENLGDAERYSP